MNDESKDAIARAYARMDAETAAHLRGEEVDADRELLDARQGIHRPHGKAEKVHHADLPELEPVELLLAIVATASVESFDPLSEPSPLASVPRLAPEERHDSPEYDPHAHTERGLTPEAMCRAWGRVVSREIQANVTLGRNWRPTFSVRSQLDGAATIATHLACLTGELERPPTLDEQAATAVESTVGFPTYVEELTLHYVYRNRILDEPSVMVVLFHALLAYEWPLGFRQSRYESLTRGEQVRLLQEDVERKQAGAPLARHPKRSHGIL